MNDYDVKTLIESGKCTFFSDLNKNPNLKKIKIDELLYSKGPELNASLSLIMKNVIPYFNSKSINFDYFPQLDPLLFAEILSTTNLIKSFK